MLIMEQQNPVTAAPISTAVLDSPIKTLDGLSSRRSADSSDELPAVYQPPILQLVNTKFYEAGQHQPLPFPASDD